MTLSFYYEWPLLGGMISEKQYKVRRIVDLEVCDVYIAKNDQYNYCLLVQVSQNYLDRINLQDVNVKSLKLDFTQLGNKYNFSIQLLNSKDIQIFDYFIHYLLINIRTDISELEFLQYLILNVKKWQNFMNTASKEILTEQQIRGLIAELFQLNIWLEEYPLCHKEIMNSWVGPEKSHHDFIFYNISFEIKSIGSSDKDHIMISSEHQLTTFSDKLYLIVIKTIRTNEDSDLSISLNNIIHNIKTNIANELHNVLDSKLWNVGYVFNEQYEQYRYIVSQKATYYVNADFPKITTENLPIGIQNVKYNVDLNVIERFKNTQIIKIF